MDTVTLCLFVFACHHRFSQGGFLDFTYPEALNYWTGLLDNLLVGTGVDGFKCDGTDPYILELDLVGGAKGHDGRLIHYREYADLYYGTFFNHSRTRNPNAIIWSRPVVSVWFVVVKYSKTITRTLTTILFTGSSHQDTCPSVVGLVMRIQHLEVWLML